MQPKWLGPYTVADSLGKGLYRLKNPSTEHILKKAVHSVRLKPYKTPDHTKHSQVTGPDVIKQVASQTPDKAQVNALH